MTYQEQLEAGLAALRENRVGDALAALQACVDEQPDGAQGHLYLGVAYGLDGTFELAEEHLKRAAELAPRDPQALFNLARLWHRQGRLADAYQGYQRVLALKPDHAKAKEELAKLAPPAAPAAPVAEPAEAGSLADPNYTPSSSGGAQAAPDYEGGLGDPNFTPGAPAPTADLPEAPAGQEQPFAGASPRSELDLTLRTVDVGSAAKTGLVVFFGVGLVYAAVMAFVFSSAQGAAAAARGPGFPPMPRLSPAMVFIGVALAMPFVGVLAGAIDSALYNGLARWLGPVQAEVEWTRRNVRIRRVDILSTARICTGLAFFGYALMMLIYIPLILLVSGLSGGHGGARVAGMAIGLVIGLVVGGLILLGVAFVVSLLAAAFYNLLAGPCGGIQYQPREAGRWTVVESIKVWPSALTLYVMGLPFGLLGLVAALATTNRQQITIQIVSLVVGLLVQMLFFGTYNLSAKMLGGLRVRLEED